jgi:peptidoglycan/LPS O-acetylase OafA/YrhL
MAEQESLLNEADTYRLSEEGTHDHSDIESIQNEKPYRRGSLAKFLSHFPLPLVSIQKTGRLRYLHKYGIHLIPSFLHPSGHNHKEPKQLRKTAALDGLRGISALFVLNYHYLDCFVQINAGYIVGIPHFANYKTIWNLPIIKFLYNGSAMVHVFFAISGYILSLRSLQQMKKRNLEGVVVTLSSSTLRRTMRLLAPTTISMFIEMFAIQLGFFEHSRSNLHLFPGAQVGLFPAPMTNTLLEKFTQLRQDVLGMGNIFNWSDYHNGTFDGNLWTIGFEYRCSMALFLLILATCRIHNPLIRRTLVITMAIIYNPYMRWDFHLFMGGMLLADFDAWSDNDSEPNISGKHQLFWGFITFAGLFLCSCPMNEPQVALGFEYITLLGKMVYPAFSFRFAWSIGAGCMVAAAMHSIHVRWVLETKVVQYLGRISYMLYVVHGPLLRAWGLTIVPFIWRCMTPEISGSSPAFYPGMILGYFFFLAVVIWWADVYTRLLDDKCVALARWFENKCINA